MEVTKERCQKIIASGANVVLCSKGIDDFALKYFVEAKIIAIRRVKKGDLRRIASCTGGKIIISLVDEHGNEEYDPSNLGTCGKVYEKRVGDWEYTFFEEL
jgi:T-complex protein 1 subunit alpha